MNFTPNNQGQGNDLVNNNLQQINGSSPTKSYSDNNLGYINNNGNNNQVNDLKVN
jgi:hypothetical protein